MPLPQQPLPSNMAPPQAAQVNQPGSGEPDGGPMAPQQPQAPMPSQGQPTGGMAPNPTQINSPGSGEQDGAQNGQANPQDQQIVQALQQHLDGLQPEDKQFLAAHLTPEFVRAIGLINGPAVAGYLNQFADPSKVLVPVPRQIATQVLAKMQASKGAAPQGQGSSDTAGMQPSQQGQQSAMMTPQPNAPATSPV